MSASDWTIAVIAFVAMEPVTALVHRRVMHGFGVGWHRSHHVGRGRGFEANDLYPATFAASTVLAMAVGVLEPGLGVLLAVGVGVTAYGLSYLVVHEVLVHRRIRPLEPLVELTERRLPVVRGWSRAHALHHRFGREPYGMLVPVVSAAVRARASASVEERPSPHDRRSVLTGAGGRRDAT